MVRMGGTENSEGQVCWKMVGVKELKKQWEYSQTT